MANRFDIGAAWLKEGEGGDEYISISIRPEALEQLDLANCWISMTINDRKRSQKQPDYILMAKPKAESSARKAAAKNGFPRPGQPRTTKSAPQQSAAQEDDSKFEDHQDLDEAAEELLASAKAKREERPKDWFFRSKRTW